MSSNSAATLKGKLQTLEESISQVAEEMNAHKKEVASLKAEKDSLTDLLRLKNNEVKQTLTQELNKVEEEMKRHFAHQKAENSRLQQQISQLKTEKTVLSNQLQAIQRRIVDLEMQVGNDDLKY
jgi:chromosome segregation ATPase